MNRIFQLSNHAMDRMATRQVSNFKVAQTLFQGQIYAAGRGLFKALLYEHYGKIVDRYTVIFSKQDNLVVTVEHTVRRVENTEEEPLSKRKLRKIYKQRKRALQEQEFDSWCREEYGNYNLSFTA